jgi:hypothetical protein
MNPQSHFLISHEFQEWIALITGNIYNYSDCTRRHYCPFQSTITGLHFELCDAIALASPDLCEQLQIALGGTHAQKSVTWYGELIECCKLTDDTQHYSKQSCLFEIVGTALIIEPEVTELSILSVAVQESQAKSKVWYSHSWEVHRINLSPGWDILARGHSTAPIWALAINMC